MLLSQVLADAKAVDDAAKAGKDVGPLCGLAYAVKDNIDVVGYPTSGGTPALEGMMPPNSSTLITKLLDAHGIVLGKMRMVRDAPCMLMPCMSRGHSAHGNKAAWLPMLVLS